MHVPRLHREILTSASVVEFIEENELSAAMVAADGLLTVAVLVTFAKLLRI